MAQGLLETESLSKQKEAKQDLSNAAEAGNKLVASLRKAGFDDDARAVEKITQTLAELKKQPDAARLDKLIQDTKLEIAELKSKGMDGEAAELEKMLSQMEASRNKQEEANIAQENASFLEADEKAAIAEGDADDSAQSLEEALRDAGLEKDANTVEKLREALASGEMTGAELQTAAAEAHALKARMYELGNQPLAEAAGDLATKLDEAAKAKLEAEMKGKRMEADSTLHQARTRGRVLAGELRNSGDIEDSKAVDTSMEIVNAVLSGLRASVELGEAIKGCEVEAAKLKTSGKEKAATELTAINALIKTADSDFKIVEQDRASIDALESSLAAERAKSDAASIAESLEETLMNEGLNDEAKKIHELRDALERDDMTPEEMEDAVHEALELSDRLRTLGKEQLTLTLTLTLIG